MRDIAAAAGVSQSTVSRVLNDAPTRVPIAAETRERVVLAARRLGYRPNPLARGLRGAPTMLLGAVVRDFSDPFFAGAIETLAVEAMARGYNVVLGHAHGRLEEAIALTTVLETRHTDAIVLLGDMQDQPRLLEDLRNSDRPGRRALAGLQPARVPDGRRRRSGRRCMAGLEYLVGLGHERIAFVSAQLPGDNPVRRDAYVDFMRERFGASRPATSSESRTRWPAARRRSARCSTCAEPPTAVVASTDLVAVGVLHAAYSLGRTVPDELSVVGFDDILIAAHTVPALTTLRMPMPEIVGEGVKLAIELARDPVGGREPRITVVRADPRRPPVDGTGRQRSLVRRLPSAGSRRASARRRGSPRRSMARPARRWASMIRCRAVGRASPARRRGMAMPEVRPRVDVRGLDTIMPAGDVVARDGPEVGRRVELQAVDVAVRRQVRRLDAVHERTALERDAAADRVDARVRHGCPARACPGRGRPCRPAARPASPWRCVGAAGRPAARPPDLDRRRSGTTSGTRSDSVHGASGRLGP